MERSLITIRLSRLEIEYLSTAGALGEAALSAIANTKWQSTTVAQIRLHREMAEEFRNIFTERLAKIGFDENYELTTEGRMLEDLIDKFSPN